MTKYQADVRMEVILYVLQEKNSIRDAAQKYGIGKSVVHRWVQRYKENGPEELFTNQGHYTTDFKVTVLSYMFEKQLNYAETGQYFSIANPSTIKRWEKTLLQEGIAGFNKQKGRLPGMEKSQDQAPKKHKIGKPRVPLTREEELLAENERLRMENAYLKKLNALVQERERSEKKTK